MSADTRIDLADFARRVHSETGEDGILEKIFALLGTASGFFVEFGAWDGRRLSNTRLLSEKGWQGILIEGDDEKFAALERNVEVPGVKPIHAFVDTSGEHSLDAILSRQGCPQSLDLLSIDIDSDDLAVWMSVKQFRARCVVIEYNPSIPFDTDFVNPKGRNWGNSALTITRFAKSRSYALVAMTRLNLIFLDSDDTKKAGIAEIVLDTRHAPDATRFFWGYDGTLIAATRRGGGQAPELFHVPFHDYAFPQPMPKFLRRWHLGKAWRRRERLISAWFLLMSRPATYLRNSLRRRSPDRRTVS